MSRYVITTTVNPEIYKKLQEFRQKGITYTNVINRGVVSFITPDKNDVIDKQGKVIEKLQKELWETKRRISELEGKHVMRS